MEFKSTPKLKQATSAFHLSLNIHQPVQKVMKARKYVEAKKKLDH